MKKIILLIFTILLVLGIFNSSVFAGGKFYTRNLYNGHFLIAMNNEQADFFLNGVIDGVGKMAPGKLGTIYPGKHRENVISDIKNYYVSNPDKLDRPIADVLLSGCK